MGIRKNQIGPLYAPVIHDTNVHYPHHGAIVRLSRVGLVGSAVRKEIHVVNPALFDNVETDFETPAPYRRGSMEVYHDAEKLLQSEITELDSQTVRLPIPPAPGGVVFLVYVPASFLCRGLNQGVKNILKDGNTTLSLDQADDTHIIMQSGTLTLPVVPTDVDDGLYLSVTRDGSEDITILPGAGATIDGGPTLVLFVDAQTVELAYYAAEQNWMVV